MSSNSEERILTSWKEIATFFGKGVRTVQRWEKNFGLPISRPTAGKNVVLASEAELREWVRRASPQLAADSIPGDGGQTSLAELSARVQVLEQKSADLSRLVERLSAHLAGWEMATLAADKDTAGRASGTPARERKRDSTVAISQD